MPARLLPLALVAVTKLYPTDVPPSALTVT